MKIAYVFEKFPSPSETFAFREMECLRRQGWEISVFCREHLENEMQNSVQIIAPSVFLSGKWFQALMHVIVRHWTRLPRLMLLWCRIAIRSPRRALGMLLDLHVTAGLSKAIETTGVKHIHGYWLGWPARMAAAVSAVTGISMSLSAHARDIFTETATLDVLARGASFIAVCTDQGLRRLSDVLGPNHSARLRLVRHGLLPEEMGALNSTHAIHSETIEIVAIGRLVEKKGFEVLLHGLQTVRDKHSNIRLTIIGDGPRKDSLSELNQRLGLNGCVHFTGWLPHEQVMEHVRQADMLVVPSVIAGDGDRDGTPNVILESFACGTPVIASRLPGIEEAIEHETSGLLITPGDSINLGKAICRLIENPQLAEKLVLGGRKILEKCFDAMANSKRLSELFREAIRQS